MPAHETAGEFVATEGIRPHSPGVGQMVDQLLKALAAVAAAAEATERYIAQNPAPTPAVCSTVHALADQARRAAATYRALRLLVERR